MAWFVAVWVNSDRYDDREAVPPLVFDYWWSAQCYALFWRCLGKHPKILEFERRLVET